MVGSVARSRARDIQRVTSGLAQGVSSRVAAIDAVAVPYVGSRASEFVRRLPSFVRGGILQSIASCRRAAAFEQRGGPAVMLVPGLFCTPGVLNGLGRELERAGLDVYLPGALAITGPIERSVGLLLEELAILRGEREVRSIALVGHSLGAIVALAAAAQARENELELPAVTGVVLLSPPLGGAPLARPLQGLLQACRDISPGARVLQLAREAIPEVVQVLSAGRDSVVPIASQEALDVPTQRLEDFQHMDYFVGSGEQVRRAARTIAAAVHEADARRRAVLAAEGAD